MRQILIEQVVAWQTPVVGCGNTRPKKALQHVNDVKSRRLPLNMHVLASRQRGCTWNMTHAGSRISWGPFIHSARCSGSAMQSARRLLAKERATGPQAQAWLKAPSKEKRRGREKEEKKEKEKRNRGRERRRRRRTGEERRGRGGGERERRGKESREARSRRLLGPARPHKHRNHGLQDPYVPGWQRSSKTVFVALLCFLHASWVASSPSKEDEPLS